MEGESGVEVSQTPEMGEEEVDVSSMSPAQVHALASSLAP